MIKLGKKQTGEGEFFPYIWIIGRGFELLLEEKKT